MNIYELAETAHAKQVAPTNLCDSTSPEHIDEPHKDHHTPLYHAIRDGDLKKTRALLKQGETLGTDRYTPFMLACFFGQLKIVKALYAAEHLEEPDVYQNTALIHAVWNGHTQVAEWLLQQGAHINATNIHGDSALLIALRNRHPDTALFLLDQEHIKKHRSNLLTYQPFVVALVYGYLDIAEALYTHKIKLDKQYTENNTLLHMCAINGNLAATNWLLAHGANTLIKNSFGYTPLMIAAIQNQLSIMSVYLAANPKQTAEHPELKFALLFAAGHGNADMVDLIFSHRKHYCSSFIQAMLLTATMNGHWPVIATILKQYPVKAEQRINKHYHYGDFQYNQGHTLLHTAADRGHLAVVQNLVAQGAKLQAKNDNEDTVLHFAVKSGNIDLVRWLCNQHVFVNQQNKQGNTPLHFAVETNNADMIRCLLMHGAHALIENRQKQTADFLAKGKPHLTACLQEFREGEFKNFGLSRIHQAVTSKEDKVILQLLPVLRDINQKTIDGVTATQFSAHMAHINPLVILILWQARGDRNHACALATALQKEHDKHSTAFKSFALAAYEIKKFPEHRLASLLKLYASYARDEIHPDLIADSPIVEHEHCTPAPSRTMGFFAAKEPFVASIIEELTLATPEGRRDYAAQNIQMAR